jgi:hypothetical protein
LTDTKMLRLLATVQTRAEADCRLKAAGDAVLVERGRPRLLVLCCPCGCGDVYPINLDARAGKAWRLYRGGRLGHSLYPSVWRDVGCESHFIVWRDRIFVFGAYGDDFEDVSGQTADLVEIVRRRLSRTAYTRYSDVADELEAIPWDVLIACRRLVRAGVAFEGKGRGLGSFRLL